MDGLGLNPARRMRLPLLLLLGGLAGLHAADWPQFLGPQRTGSADAAEPPLPERWAADAPPLWQKPVGSGFAGPVVAEGKVIVCHREGGDMTTEALEAATGRVLWRHAYVTDYVDSFGFDNGPRATPAIAGGRVFIHGPEGRVTALDLATGKELWACDTVASFGSPQGFFGRAPSPLVIGERVFIAAGGERNGAPAGLVALNAADGRPVWQSVDDEAGYASPVAASPTCVLAWMRNRLWLVDAAQGRVLQSLPLRSGMDASVNAATPLDCGAGRWLVSAGYGVGAHLLRLGDGPEPALATLWQREDSLDCHYSTPVLRDGHLYGFHGRQETGQVLRCVSLDDGKVRWESPRVPGGTLVRAGDKLAVVTEQGELWIVRATPERFDLLASRQILRAGHRSHPALAGGVLYARDSEHLAAIPLR